MFHSKSEHLYYIHLIGSDNSDIIDTTFSRWAISIPVLFQSLTKYLKEKNIYPIYLSIEEGFKKEDY